MDLLKTALFGMLLCAGAGATAAQAQTSHVDVMAARAKVGSENEVRLLWIVSEGWLPAGGVNLFRTDHPDKPLNGTPIMLDARALSPDAATKINRVTAVARPLFGAGIATRAENTLSSKAAFSAFKGEIQRLQVQPGIRGAQIAAQAAKAPRVVAYRSRLQAPQKVSPTRQATPLTDDEKTVSARIQVLLAALTSYKAALNLGLAFTDKTASPTTAYTYVLRSADAAATEIARVAVPLAENTAPPSPSGLDAVQTGQNSVALHWEPVSAAEEKTLLGTTYNVFRGAKRLNQSPIRIPFLPTTDGGHIAPMTSFIDRDAPLGTVHYTVTMTDAFGRVSPAASLDVSMTDSRVPAPIPRVVAAVSQATPGAVRVYWVAPDINAGDITPSIGAGLTQVIPAAVTAIYRAEGGQPEITLAAATDAVLTDMNTIMGQTLVDMNKVIGQIPADILDLRVADFLALAPDFHPGISTDDLRDQSVDKLYARLNLDGKIDFYHATRNIRSYLDTTATVDKDYRYHVVPGYAINPGHFGTGSYSLSVAVPTRAIPAAPADFGGTFAKGQGDFGFVEASAAPKMRRQGMAGAEIEQPRVKESALKNAKPLSPRKAAEKAPPMTIAGHVTLSWQPVPFSSKVRYQIFRAAATGLFPAAQSAAVGVPPVIPNLNTVPKLGSPQRPSIKSVAQQRHQYIGKYFANFPGVPLQNYSLLTVTDKTQFVDTVPASQRMHYDYRIVPISRWGVEGVPAPVADIAIPATLPPSLPTLLKTQVDENVADGHVRLTISANPTDENVAKFLVFRKPIADAMQAAQREVSAVRVASARAIAAPPLAAMVPQSRVRSLGIKEIRANSSAILKRLLEPEGYIKIGEIAATAAPTFVDTTGVPRVPYSYQIVAVNTDSIGSKPSSPLDATAIKVHCDAPRNFAAAGSGEREETGASGIVARLSGAATTDISQVKLTWQAPALEVPTHYVLERSTERLGRGVEGAKREQSVFVTLDGALAGESSHFVDASIRSGRKYTYRLCAVDSEGLFSEPRIVSIVVPALVAANFGDPAPGTNTTPPNTAPTPAPPPVPTPLPGAALGKMGAPRPPSRGGRFGETYFVTAEQQFAVRVEKAVYSLAGYAIDAQNYYYCRPNERFVKLTLRVKNASREPQSFDYQTITAHTVGADDSAFADTKNWKALDTGRLANRTVAPGGEFVVEGIVVAPADQTPRAIAFGDCAFDFSDPANALPDLEAHSEQPAALLAPCPLAYTVGAIESAGRSGGSYVVSVTVRNATLAPLTLGPQNIIVEPFDQDGDKYAAEPGKSDTQTLTPGATTSLRFVFKVPQAVQIQQIKLREKDSRVYVISPGVQ